MLLLQIAARDNTRHIHVITLYLWATAGSYTEFSNRHSFWLLLNLIKARYKTNENINWL